jgi:hypothetical protein
MAASFVRGIFISLKLIQEVENVRRFPYQAEERPSSGLPAPPSIPRKHIKQRIKTLTLGQ